MWSREENTCEGCWLGCWGGHIHLLRQKCQVPEHHMGTGDGGHRASHGDGDGGHVMCHIVTCAEQRVTLLLAY